jgi:hypothetical protein
VAHVIESGLGFYNVSIQTRKPSWILKQSLA